VVFARLDPAGCPVVVTGAWNIAIFAPPWVRRHLLKPDAPLVAQIGFFPASVGFTAGDVQLSITSQDLRATPTDDTRSALSSAEDLVVTVLKKLPETPIGVVGVNFAFTFDAPTPAVEARLADAADWKAFGRPVARVYTRVVSVNDAERINVSLQELDGTFRLEFNHHVVVGKAAGEAVAVVRETVLAKLDLSKRLARDIYDLEQRAE
jgi:hypothetical protein